MKVPLTVAIQIGIISLVAVKGSVSARDNSLLLGSNLGCWGVNPDGSINEPFLNNPKQRQLAKAVMGIMRFPCRSFSDSQITAICDSIRSEGIKPLVIIPSNNTDRAIHIVELLKDRATYFEFGNEDNYARKWSGGKYAERWTNDIPRLREKHPNMKIGGPVVSHISDTGSQYVREFLDAIKSDSHLYPNFISAHIYVEHGENRSNEEVLAEAATWGARVDALRADIQTRLGKQLSIAITEWNWDAVPENPKAPDNRDMDSEFMRRFTFTVLDQFRAHGVWMSCQYDFGAGAGGGHLDIVTPRGIPKPQYDAYLAWSEQDISSSAEATETDSR